MRLQLVKSVGGWRDSQLQLYIRTQSDTCHQIQASIAGLEHTTGSIAEGFRSVGHKIIFWA